MSRSFFAPDTKVAAPPTDSARAPFLAASNGEDSKDERLGIRSEVVAAKPPLSSMAPILSYCVASITMTVMNKFVLKTHFSLNLVVLLIQSMVGCALVVGAKQANLIDLKPLNVATIQAWLPVSTGLVFVIWTGSKALQYLSIPVYTIFKNLTIILIAYGEVFWFNGKISRLTMISFILMVVSSIVAAYSDIAAAFTLDSLRMPHTPDSLAGGSVDPATHVKTPAFDMLGQEKANIAALDAANNGQDLVLDSLSGYAAFGGYLWMFLNCLCSAGFVLGMRGRMKSAQLKDWDAVLHNNLLTIPVLLAMSLLVEDWSSANWASNFPPETRYSLMSAIIFSGACAVMISYCTAWCIRATSSTTYSITGAVNKLPLALSGLLFFGDPATFSSIGSIALGFAAGLIYAVAKNKESQEEKRAQASAATGTRGSESPKGREGIIPMHHMNGKEERND